METRMGRPYGRLFCLLPMILLIAIGLRAAEIPPTTTQVHDTVYRANGTPAAGSVTISWPAFETADHKTVAAGMLNVKIGAAGLLDVPLVPNQGATPSGTYYTVVTKLDDGTTKTELWNVPATSPVTVASIRTAIAPPKELPSENHVQQAEVSSTPQANKVLRAGADGRISRAWLDPAVLNVKDFGAKCDGETDDTAAFRAAIAAAPYGHATIYIPGDLGLNANRCLITDTLTIAHDRIHIKGDGPQTSRIEFHPTSARTLFYFGRADGTLVQASLKDIGLMGFNDQTKTAIETRNVGEMEIESVATYPWTGGNSIGIHTRGREYLRMTNLDISADRPMVISKNTDVPAIDLDHTFCDGCWFTTLANHPLIEVEDDPDGMFLSNISFIRNAWTGGSSGFYWNDTHSSAISTNLNFRDNRYEQAITPNAWGIYIRNHTSVHNIAIDGFYTSGTPAEEATKGIFIDGADDVTFKNYTYAPTGLCMELGSNVRRVSFVGAVYCNTGSTATIAAASVRGTYDVGGNIYTVVPNSVNLKFNPNTTAGLPQLEGPGMAVTNGGTACIASGTAIGAVVISSMAGVSGLVRLSGSYHTVAVIFGDSGWFGNAANAANYNIYWNAAGLGGAGCYTIQNHTGTDTTFWAEFLGRGEH